MTGWFVCWFLGLSFHIVICHTLIMMIHMITTIATILTLTAKSLLSLVTASFSFAKITCNDIKIIQYVINSS